MTTIPSADELMGQWTRRVGSAKIAWGKLTKDELLQSEGHSERLTDLVQERYALARDEAGQQVNEFLEKISR